MRINPDRLVGTSYARQNLATLLNDVEDGKVFHVMRENAVIAHIVPSNTLVLDSMNLESGFVSPIVEKTAKRFAGEVIDQGYNQVDDEAGRLLSWLWNSDRSKALFWFMKWAQEVAEALEENRYSRPTFGPFWRALSIGLGVGLTAPEIEDFKAYVCQNLPRLNADTFSASELAGGQRPRRRDDPWADGNEVHFGYAKRRWCHLEVGQMIPSTFGGHKLPSSDDDWCKIVQIVGPSALVLQNCGDNTELTTTDVSMWIPTRNKEPWRWGMARYL